MPFHPGPDIPSLRAWCHFHLPPCRECALRTLNPVRQVYVDSRNLGYDPFVWRYCNGRAAACGQAHAAQLRALFERYVPKLVDFVLDGPPGAKPLRQAVPVTNLNMVSQLCAMLDCLLAGGDGASAVPLDPSLAKDNGASLEAAFVYACVWSIGATVVATAEFPDRAKFEKRVKEIAGLPELDGDVVPIGSLPAGSLYDFCFDHTECRWKSWKSLVPKYAPPMDGKFASILVPTTDTVRSASLLSLMVAAGRAVLFVGASGTAKTVTISRALMALEPTQFNSLILNFSSRTGALAVQQALEGSVEKRTKDT